MEKIRKTIIKYIPNEELEELIEFNLNNEKIQIEFEWVWCYGFTISILCNNKIIAYRFDITDVELVTEKFLWLKSQTLDSSIKEYLNKFNNYVIVKNI